MWWRYVAHRSCESRSTSGSTGTRHRTDLRHIWRTNENRQRNQRMKGQRDGEGYGCTDKLNNKDMEKDQLKRIIQSQGHDQGKIQGSVMEREY